MIKRVPMSGQELSLKEHFDSGPNNSGHRHACFVQVSKDSRWAVILYRREKYRFFVVDVVSAEVRKAFTVEFQEAQNPSTGHAPIVGDDMIREPFAGLDGEDRILLWREVRVPPADRSQNSAPYLWPSDIALETWSLDGELVRSVSFGRNLALHNIPVGFWQPVVDDTRENVLFPAGEEGFDSSPVGAEMHDESGDKWFTKNSPRYGKLTPVPETTQLLSVNAVDCKKPRLAVRDAHGTILAETTLPLLPNLLPIAVDFCGFDPKVSSDGESAIVAVHRSAWVLIDTDRDWGSAIFLFRVKPLEFTSRLRLGTGYADAFAVDHRNGQTRINGFWAGRWHEKLWNINKQRWDDVK